jgi:threonine dehydrogenase-like Zn-dependent dehydrogenase
MAAVKVGPGRTEVHEFPLPDVPPEAGLLRIEAAGVCGSDVGSYPRPTHHGQPHVMGHENVGRIVKLGREAAARWGLREGDRVALEEYLPCGACAWCYSSDFRLCDKTDVHRADAVRYGLTPTSVAPAIWGGFAEYLYLHPNSVFHMVPEHVPAEQAALALPLGNGWEWAYVEGGAAPGKTVLIQGPGQQGLGCVIAAKEANAACIIVSGLTQDTERLAVARALGADHTIDAQTEDLRERVLALTDGRGVDVVIDVAAASEATLVPAIDLLKKRGTLVVPAGRMEQTTDHFPIGKMKVKYLTLKAVRGHSYHAVERALEIIASGRYPMDRLCSHQFGVAQTDEAIRTAAGERGPGAVHVSVVPGAAAHAPGT